MFVILFGVSFRYLIFKNTFQLAKEEKINIQSNANKRKYYAIQKYI